MRRPFNEWTFTHMNWLMPTDRVARGPVTRPLPVDPVISRSVDFQVRLASGSVAACLL
jgi:hypothetical protein